MSTPDELRWALVSQLQSLSRSGLKSLPRSGETGKAAAGQMLADFLENPVAPADGANLAQQANDRSARDASERSHLDEPASDAYGPTLNREDRVQALKVLQAEVAQCTRCSELVASRTQTVFGVGPPDVRLCFFGEAPGADEDQQGEPFVGKAGQLLNKVIAAMKLTREEVYILNAVKCRPRMNRTPADSEIENCWGFAERQLEILQPEFICCLGAVAVRSLLKVKGSINSLRGKFHPYRGSQVVVTYHPAYLLREPAAKRLVWEDMQMLMRAMGIAV